MNQQARTALTRARAAMIMAQPFWGALALRLQLREDPKIKTLQVDGVYITYNPDFVLTLTPPEQQAAMAHEVGHCMLDHLTRIGSREPNRWNAAGDYVINAMLKNSNFTIGKTWLFEPSFAGKSTDEIYDTLPPMPPGGSAGGALDEMQKPAGTAGSEAADSQMRAEWRIATMQAAQAARNAGKLPGDLERFIEKVTEPKVNWREQLRNLVKKVAQNDYSWSRPNRRFLAHHLYLPGLYSERNGTVAVVTDDSGSISQAYFDAFAAEIHAIIDMAQPEKTIHISCDAAVNVYAEYDDSPDFKMQSKGGGGTDFRPPFRELRKRNVKPDVLVYLTDGYGPFPDRAPEYPVIWVMTTGVQPPWGDCVRINVHE